MFFFHICHWRSKSTKKISFLKPLLSFCFLWKSFPLRNLQNLSLKIATLLFCIFDTEILQSAIWFTSEKNTRRINNIIGILKRDYCHWTSLWFNIERKNKLLQSIKNVLTTALKLIVSILNKQIIKTLINWGCSQSVFEMRLDVYNDYPSAKESLKK